jgi:hypothetical protein
MPPNPAGDTDEIRKARPAPETVGQRLDDVIVVVQLDTSRIHEFNRTGGRFWELLQDEEDLGVVEQALLEEFDVSREQLHGEIQRLAASLAEERLITVLERA